MNYYLYPPFFVIDPQTSFDEAWEVFCCEILNLENETNLIRRRIPPDLGADLVWDTEKIIYQCKAVYNGETGGLDINKTKKSIDRALENRHVLGWERYILCTNVDLTGEQERKLKEHFPSIEFRTKNYWINLCKKFPQSVSNRFRFLLDTSASTTKFWSMPYYRNLYFTGQESILTTIYTRWHNPADTAIPRYQALYGLGGIGKTQIAMEYAYRYRQIYSAVFWIRASTKETLMTDILKISNTLHLVHEESYNDSISQQKIITLVKNWLVQNKDWLVIFDNIEDLSLISDILPTEENGYTLLTTRDRFVEHIANSIEIEKLNKENGRLLLLKRAKMISQEESSRKLALKDLQAADTLVDLMGGLPLAIDQAGAYILETNCSLVQYHNLYLLEQTALLNRPRALIKRIEPQTAVFR